jgi:drug/metabolite transporter (DMT)-like permease
VSNHVQTITQNTLLQQYMIFSKAQSPSINKAVLYGILSAFLFSLMNLCIKHLSESISVPQIAFFRAAVGGMITFAILHYRGESFKSQKPLLLFLRGLLGAIAVLGQFYAIANIKLGDAVILSNLTPVFVVFLAYLFLGERLNGRHVLFLIVSLVGAFLVIKPGGSFEYSFYSTVALLSTVLIAGSYTTIRALSPDHSSLLITFYFLGITSVVTLPFVIDFPSLSFEDVFFILAMSVIGLLAQITITKAFRFEKAAVVTMTRYIGIVFNIAWGYFLWNESLDLYSLLGGLLIIGACIKVLKLKEPR